MKLDAHQNSQEVATALSLDSNVPTIFVCHHQIFVMEQVNFGMFLFYAFIKPQKKK